MSNLDLTLIILVTAVGWAVALALFTWRWSRS